MEGENRVRRFHGTELERREKDSRYIQRILRKNFGIPLPPIATRHSDIQHLCYYMAWKEVADTLEVGELTHKLRTHTRRFIHEFSLATGTSNHGLP